MSRQMKRGYKGPIEPGMTFLWEPFIPHATEHLRVDRVTGPGDDEIVVDIPGTRCTVSGGHETRVWSRSWVATSKISGDYTGPSVFNDESRFRGAVVRIPEGAGEVAQGG
jgi:hypothetical protein